MIVSIENAEHYIWGDNCDDWHLLKCDDMSIIQERVPAGANEDYYDRGKNFNLFVVEDS